MAAANTIGTVEPKSADDASHVVVLAATAVGATPAAPSAAPPPKVGQYAALPLESTYTLATRNTGSFLTQVGAAEVRVEFTCGARIWEGRKVITHSACQVTLLTRPEPDGAWIAILGPGDEPLLRYDPPIGYEWPLEVGKMWSRNHRFVFGTGQSLPVNITCKVEAYEEVKVPAGTFRAFRVSYTRSDGVEQRVWFVPYLGIFAKSRTRRNASYWAGGAGMQEQELVCLNFNK